MLNKVKLILGLVIGCVLITSCDILKKEYQDEMTSKRAINNYTETCIDGITYIIIEMHYQYGITVKMDSKTKQPINCR